ncbi:hypothetical protein N7453_010973 [Penicillium expansum]|nr:hypothetical protein N7453_010973 [Penicillium expansum]
MGKGAVEREWADVAYPFRFWGMGMGFLQILGWIVGKSGGGSATEKWDVGLCCEGLGFDRVGNDIVAMDVGMLKVQWQEQVSEMPGSLGWDVRPVRRSVRSLAERL